MDELSKFINIFISIDKVLTGAPSPSLSHFPLPLVTQFHCKNGGPQRKKKTKTPQKKRKKTKTNRNCEHENANENEIKRITKMCKMATWQTKSGTGRERERERGK